MTQEHANVRLDLNGLNTAQSKEDIKAQQAEEFVSTKETFLATVRSLFLETESVAELKRAHSEEREKIADHIAFVEKETDGKVLDKQLSTITDTLERISSLCRDSYRIRDHLSNQIFDHYDIKTPNALGERDCDELVQAILEGYGYRTGGANMAEKRNIRNCSFAASYVPKAVKELVAKQFVKSDANLDSVHVIQTLQRAKLEIKEQRKLQDCQPLIALFSSNETIKPSQVIEVAQEEDLLEVSPNLLDLQVAYYRYQKCEALVRRLSPLLEPLQATLMLVDSLAAQRESDIEHQAAINSERSLIDYWSHSPHSAKFFVDSLYVDLNDIDGQKKFLDGLSRYGTEEDKNIFVSVILAKQQHVDGDFQKSKTEGFANRFISLEIDSIRENITENPSGMQDELIARVPRLVFLNFKMGKETAGEFSKSLDVLRQVNGYPHWIDVWMEYATNELRAERINRVSECPKNCAAYGRFYGEEILYEETSAIQVNASQARRGRTLSAQNAELMRN